MTTTRFYNAENKCYRTHCGLPRKADTFEKNSVDATRIELWFWYGQKVFTKDAAGRWVGTLEGSGGNYSRDVLTKKRTLMHVVSERVSKAEADIIIGEQTAKVMDEARKAIAWCQSEDEKDEDGRYWLSAYRGADTYRLIVKDHRILGSIPGGFHDSRRSIGICFEAWLNALTAAIEEKVGTGYALPKADGSGTYFYLRNSSDAELLSTREYDVPSAQGGTHHNIEVINN